MTPGSVAPSSVQPGDREAATCSEMLEDDAPGTLDVFFSGPLFLDIVFTGLSSELRPGTEVWASGMGSLPGGIANLAVAAARLGLSTGLSAGFGDDLYGRWCWDLLADEGIDLSWSARVPGQHTAVTACIQYDGDRSMVTHGHPFPLSYDEMIGHPPRSRAVVLNDLGANRAEERWWKVAAEDGAQVFADTGWDSTASWDPSVLQALDFCHAFLPNELEAMAYTRTDTPQRALRALADRVPVAVVTMGGAGAIAIDNETGEEASVPALQVPVRDSTGAGDVFVAAFAAASLWGLPLEERLSMASLSSALAVQQLGGSLAAPGVVEILAWYESQRGEAGDAGLAARYGFLPDLLGGANSRPVRRADPTPLGGMAA